MESSAHFEGPEHRLATSGALMLLLFVLVCSVVELSAQSVQFLPEVDVYYKVDPAVRLDFQAKETREAGDPPQAEIGPSLDLFVKRLVLLEKIPLFDPDRAQSRVLQWFLGYRYLPSVEKPTVERMELGFIANVPLSAKLLLSDRNRADLDWSTGPFVWRYRNRAKLQAAIAIRSYRPAPYASAEVYYQSQYQKWSTAAVQAGCLFPIRSRFAIDLFYEHQNLTGKHPNQQLNQWGAVLNMHFSTRRSRK